MKGFGEFEAAAKKTYISYRVKKQFVMIGPGTKGRLDIGLNCKELPEDERLEAQGPGKMCHFLVRITDISEIDDALMSWIHLAYQGAQ